MMTSVGVISLILVGERNRKNNNRIERFESCFVIYVHTLYFRQMFWSMVLLIVLSSDTCINWEYY